MCSDLAPAASGARSDSKCLHITAHSQAKRRMAENKPEAACRERPLSGTIIPSENARDPNSRVRDVRLRGMINCEQLARTAN
jgi:hypothetical protein